LAPAAALLEKLTLIYLAEATLKTHLAAIYRKLGVVNRLGAVTKARNLNLLT
jgi:ATP/maltotriose-dependent transcriptional regulator MalT